MKTFNLRDEGTITEIFRLKVWIKPVSVLAPPENENPTKRKGILVIVAYMAGDCYGKAG